VYNRLGNNGRRIATAQGDGQSHPSSDYGSRRVIRIEPPTKPVEGVTPSKNLRRADNSTRGLLTLRRYLSASHLATLSLALG
jgi:hypothetical protein